MSDTIIVKNNTAASVFIEDMGTAVPGSGQRTFSDIFDFNEICVSEDLLSNVVNSTFTINDGTDDLSISDAIEYLKCKNAEITYDEIGGLFNVQTLQSNAISSTTSLTYIDKLTLLITTTNDAGEYLILTNADFQSLNHNKQVAVRLYNVTNDITYSESVQQTNNNTNWFSFSTHQSINFDGLEDVTISIQYKQFSGTTCNIRNCNISLWRIG